MKPSNSVYHILNEGDMVLLSYSTNVGFFYLADSNNFSTNIILDESNPSVIPHVLKMIAKEAAIAWGTPSGRSLKIQFLFPDEKQLNSLSDIEPKNYSAAVRFILQTQGEVVFGNQDDIWLAAHTKSSKIGEFSLDDPKGGAHVFKIDNGRYLISIFRHFPWIEGEQDAELGSPKAHYSIIFSRSLGDDKLPHMSIPWVRELAQK